MKLHVPEIPRPRRWSNPSIGPVYQSTGEKPRRILKGASGAANPGGLSGLTALQKGLDPSVNDIGRERRRRKTPLRITNRPDDPMAVFDFDFSRGRISTSPDADINSRTD